jgi:hypothetical protein
MSEYWLDFMSVTSVSRFKLTSVGDFNRLRKSYGNALHIRVFVKTYSSCLPAFCTGLYLNNRVRMVCSCLR